MKQVVLLTLTLFLSINMCGQPLNLITGDPTCLTGFSSLPPTLKPIFKKAYCAVTCEVINPFTGECDIVSTEPLTSEKLLTSNNAKKKSLLTLEEAIAMGKGKRQLPKSYLDEASVAHPGKKLKALKKRFIFIITKMESETEDE